MRSVPEKEVKTEESRAERWQEGKSKRLALELLEPTVLDRLFYGWTSSDGSQYISFCSLGSLS